MVSRRAWIAARPARSGPRPSSLSAAAAEAKAPQALRSALASRRCREIGVAAAGRVDLAPGRHGVDRDRAVRSEDRRAPARPGHQHLARARAPDPGDRRREVAGAGVDHELRLVRLEDVEAAEVVEPARGPRGLDRPCDDLPGEALDVQPDQPARGRAVVDHAGHHVAAGERPDLPEPGGERGQVRDPDRCADRIHPLPTRIGLSGIVDVAKAGGRPARQVEDRDPLGP